MKTLFWFLCTIIAPATSLFGQQDPVGIQPFGTQFGPIDAATLNVHLSIPVVNKAGTLPFHYDLTFNNNFWSSFQGPTVRYWANGNHGWSSFTLFHGASFKSTEGELCADNVRFQLTYTQFTDPEGNAHPVGIRVDCGAPVTSTLIDGSGISVTLASETQGTSFATYPNGTVVTGTSITDTNGNAITLSGNTIIDSLGVTELTIANGNPYTYTYPAPNATTAQVTQNFGTYTLQTSFGCANTRDVGPYAGTSLVSGIVLPDGSQYSFTYEDTPGHAGYVTGRLKTVMLPTGGMIQYAYTGPNNGLNCNDGSTAGLTVTTPDGVTTYVRDTTNWNQTTVTQANGDYAIYNFASSVVGFPAYNTFPFYEVQRRMYASGGSLKLTATTCYDGNQTNCGTVTTRSVLPINQIDKYTLIAGMPTQSRTSTLFDAYNNVTDVKVYDFGAGTPTTETAITYGSYSAPNCNALGNGIVDKPCKIQRKDGAGIVLAETHLTYNATGHPTTTANLVVGSTYLSSHATYNGNGTLATSTDINGTVTTPHYTGGCNNAFATSTNYPLSLTDSMTWDCNGGVSLMHTDINGNTMSVLAYDSLWRPTSVQDQMGVITTKSYGTGGSSEETSLLFNGGASTNDSVVYRDSLGRSLQSQVKRGPSATQYNTVSYQYDVNGRLSGVSVPCQAAANTSCASGFSTKTYDALGRPLVSTSAALGTITNTYTQNDVLSVLGPAPTGEVVKQKQYEYDGLGRLLSVCEITTNVGNGACGQAVSKTGYLTKYTYDALGRITQVSLNAQGTPQTRTFAYDGLGRTTSETNPENGTTVYSYDQGTGTGCIASNGDLVSKLDANGNRTCYQYDLLHRKTVESVSSGPNATASYNRYFVYDAATVNGFTMSNTKGKLAEAYTGSPASKVTDEGFSYTARGELANLFESTPHSAGYYTISKSYWENGALKTLGGVGFPQLNYNADTMGRPTTVTTSGADPLTSATYDVAGRVTALTFGSGDTANFGFSTNSGRMTSYKETINGSVVSGTLTWSANGELQQNVIVDPFNTANAQTCTYDYDDLARIKATNCGTPWTQTFTYDVFGNLTKSGSLNWQPGYSASTNRYTLGGISYDANGNLLNDMFHTYTWDAQGKAHTIDTTTIIYDAFGNQVEKQSGGVNTEFVLGFAVMNGQTQLKAFVLLPGGAKARYVAGTISGYTVPDWVGSMRIGSKATQAYDFSLAFAPFGERYAVSGGLPYEFGGNQNNTVADEYDADNRKIHTSQGRWISPDPAGFGAASLASPQTWNRYAYVANNPLTNIDPSGLLLSDCVSCNFFNDALSAVNQTIDWSIEAQTKAFFGDKYNDLPGHNNQMATGQFSYLQDVYGGQNVTAGPNGFVITFAVSFWGPYKGGCLAGVFCIGHLTYNLFQFLDPAETKNFSFDTSFQNTVAAFKKAGFVEHWQDYLDRFHPRQLDLRDRSTFCSAHADVDKSSGQQAGQATTGQVHLDTINPWEPWFFQMPIEHYVISKVESKPCS